MVLISGKGCASTPSFPDHSKGANWKWKTWCTFREGWTGTHWRIGTKTGTCSQTPVPITRWEAERQGCVPRRRRFQGRGLEGLSRQADLGEESSALYAWWKQILTGAILARSSSLMHLKLAMPPLALTFLTVCETDASWRWHGGSNQARRCSGQPLNKNLKPDVFVLPRVE
jgi:hypothetical protein